MRCASFAALSGMLAMGSPAFAAPPLINPANSAADQARAHLQQLNAQNANRISGPVVISPARARGAKAAPGGPTIVLKSVKVAPVSAFLGAADLNAILHKYVGKRVDFSIIQQLVQDINDLYEKKGIVTASAVLPPQTLTNGVLKVRLVEGKLGAVRVQSDGAVPDSFVLDRVRLTTAGNVVDVPTAAKDITRFNRIYDAQLRLSLQPGARFGTTDMAFNVIHPRKNQLTFFIDNQGVTSTGEYEAGFYFHHYGLWTTDDNLLAYGTKSEGSISGTLSYDTPITPVGTRLTLSYSRSDIRTVAGPTVPLDIRGRSHSIIATLKQPFVVTPTWAVFGNGTASYGTSNSTSAAVPLVDSTTKRVSLGVSANYTGDKISFSIQPQIVRAMTNDKLAPLKRNITLFSGSFNGGYRLAKGLTLTGTGAWQYSHAQLLPGDLLFQIGGPSTVRGFPTDASSGDSGYFAQLEVHKTLDKVKAGIDAYGFIDLGAVYSTFPAKQFFLSGGVGMSYPLTDKAKFEIGIGFPLVKVVANQSDAVIYARLAYTAF